MRVILRRLTQTCNCDGKWGVDAGGIEAHLSPWQYAQDFCRFARLVEEVCGPIYMYIYRASDSVQAG